ncbi:OLC1v1035559C1 [Oldenlandia corymbosa var. corymbosa]|uniref:OLC1v1035559C1 n=1 Tax=Oldenlandia corymbosa var. corymbosa TaxID=529605 RepID=A0AAV1CT91_OLDCO|nr:OLC1v1035559C1 [Oldenlandia corymbosa var. corymbosa]
MSGAPRVSQMNVGDSELRSVLGPAGNKDQKSLKSRKPVSKPWEKAEKSTKEVQVVEDKNGLAPSISFDDLSSPLDSILHRQESFLQSSLSLSASCSSDASTDSFHSRASTGRIYRTKITTSRKKLLASKAKVGSSNGISELPSDSSELKKRCAWVTPTTDPLYATFHDEEWGVPAHDDKNLFELLVLCSALSELTWPCILSKRHKFREVFADFDPTVVAKLNEKKIITPGSTASSLLSELRLRAVLENARQVSKVIDEFGSFDKYIWSFVNHRPLVSRFRYPRQIPVKTPKAEVISKDLMRRGFRGVGPTVVYSFMQVAGLTNDHLVGCFRFQDCITASEGKEEAATKDILHEKKVNAVDKSKLCRSMDELSISSE